MERAAARTARGRRRSRRRTREAIRVIRPRRVLAEERVEQRLRMRAVPFAGAIGEQGAFLPLVDDERRRHRPHSIEAGHRALGIEADGERELVLLEIRRDHGGAAGVLGDRQHDEALVLVLLVQSLHARHLLLAGLAPRGPEVQQDHLALVLGKPHLPVLGRGDAELLRCSNGIGFRKAQDGGGILCSLGAEPQRQQSHPEREDRDQATLSHPRSIQCAPRRRHLRRRDTTETDDPARLSESPALPRDPRLPDAGLVAPPRRRHSVIRCYRDGVRRIPTIPARRRPCPGRAGAILTETSFVRRDRLSDDGDHQAKADFASIVAGSHVTLVADDLTGACDAGALFAGRGPVAIVVDPASPGLEWPVAAVDTESRALAASEAALAVAAAARRLRPRSERGLLFKKVDSTLRGAVGAETETLLEASGRRTALV